MERKRVFATSWHPGGANAIAPVIKQLIAEGKIEVVVIGHGFSAPIFNNIGIPFKTIQDFGLNDVSVESMRALLKRVSPDLILIGTAGQEGKGGDVIEQTVTVAARNLGIKSLAVLDYWANYSQRFTDERAAERLGFLPDRIAIMDEIAEKDMLTEGFPKEKLVVTGNPHFDSLSAKAESFTEAQRQETRQRIGLPYGTIFFFAGNLFSGEKSAFGFWDLDIIELVVQTVPELSNVGVVVRLHPRMPEQDKQQIIEVIAKSGGGVKLVDDIDSQTLALAADLTLVANSTIGIEAVLMARPCISLQPGLSVKDPLLISREGVVPVGYDAETCRGLLRKAADAGWRQQVLKDYSGFATEGKSTGRVVQLVYQSLPA